MDTRAKEVCHHGLGFNRSQVVLDYILVDRSQADLDYMAADLTHAEKIFVRFAKAAVE